MDERLFIYNFGNSKITLMFTVKYTFVDVAVMLYRYLQHIYRDTSMKYFYSIYEPVSNVYFR